MTQAAVFPYLAGWTVVSLRPLSQQAAVARAVEAYGARAVALPGVRLEAMPGAESALDAAFACRRVVFTSPAAVEFADAVRPLSHAGLRTVIAVGSGTARVLAARGVLAHQPPPAAMRSEGVLALAEFAAGDDPVGLVTAPGGRGAIESALRERGVTVAVALVYRRCEPIWNCGELDALATVGEPSALLVTSGEALANVLALLPADARLRLLSATAVTSSERLAQATRAAGFDATLVAAAPTVESLLDALAAHAKPRAIR